MTVTFTPVVLAHQRKKDGTYNVKIRVTFRQRSRYLATTLTCTQADLTRSLKLKNGDLINKAGDLCRRMREAVSDLSPFDLEHRDVDWVYDYVTRSLSGENFRLDFFEFADEWLACKKEKTRCSYTAALNGLERFLGCRSIDVNDIRKQMLREFMAAVDKEKKIYFNQKTHELVESSKERKNKATSTRYVDKLQTIFEAARKRYNDDDVGVVLIPRTPFDDLDRVYPPNEGQESLGRELMQKIILSQAPTARIRTALDVFVVAFGLMAANVADLYNAVPFSGSRWVYHRQKTRDRRKDRGRAEVRCDVPDCLAPFISRLQEGEGAWWLPKLHACASNKDNCTRYINRGLADWAKLNGVPEFTFYAVRHTWASVGRSLGIEKAVLDECLAHKGDYAMADIYAERDWAGNNRANQKILDSFIW